MELLSKRNKTILLRREYADRRLKKDPNVHRAEAKSLTRSQAKETSGTENCQEKHNGRKKTWGDFGNRKSENI